MDVGRMLDDKDKRIRQLEEENAKLRSEQHEGQRVYRRLLAELEEQRVINEELRGARGDV